MSTKYGCKLSPLIINQVSIQKQMYKQCLYFQSQMQTSISVNPTEISRSVTKFEISQFLSDCNKIFSNSKFNLLYAEKKFRICYKSTLEKINYNLENVQTIKSNFNHSH